MRSSSSHTYTDGPFSKLAVEGHCDFVLVPSPLIKGVTAVEGWAVQMQANSRLCVAYVPVSYTHLTLPTILLV